MRKREFNDEKTGMFSTFGEPVIVASHPRSGTHLMIDFLRRQIPNTSISKRAFATLDHLYLNIERTTSLVRPFQPQTCKRILNSTPNPILKTHFTADFQESWIEEESGPLSLAMAELVKRAAAIYVYRDPYKVMSSYFLFLAAMDRDLEGMDLVTFANSPHWEGGRSRLEWWAGHVRGWMERPGVLSMKFENIVADPEGALLQLEAHLCLDAVRTQPLLPENNRSIWRGRIDRLLPGSPSSTAIVPKTRVRTPRIPRSVFMESVPAPVLSLCRDLGY